jgi:hypothetical protein
MWGSRFGKYPGEGFWGGIEPLRKKNHPVFSERRTPGGRRTQSGFVVVSADFFVQHAVEGD